VSVKDLQKFMRQIRAEMRGVLNLPRQLQERDYYIKRLKNWEIRITKELPQ